MFKNNNSSGYTLFEVVAIVFIMAIVFAIGTPKYLKCIRDVHNSNINIMVGTIKIWSAEQAVDNFNHAGRPKYPLPKATTIDKILTDRNPIKWDDTDPSYWKYLAGGGIEIEGDGTYFKAKPIYIN